MGFLVLLSILSALSSGSFLAPNYLPEAGTKDELAELARLRVLSFYRRNHHGLGG